MISVDGVVSLTKLGASLVGGAVNGDGFSGVLIGAAEADLARTDAGAVRLVFRASSQPGDPQAIVLRFDPDGAWRFGAAVSGADDSDGDGISDDVVGAADPSLLMPFRSGAAHIAQGNAPRIAPMPALVSPPEAARSATRGR